MTWKISNLTYGISRHLPRKSALMDWASSHVKKLIGGYRAKGLTQPITSWEKIYQRLDLNGIGIEIKMHIFIT